MPTVPTPSLPVDRKPFYASVAAGEAAFASLRARVVTLPEQLKAVQSQLQTQVKELPEQVKGLQASVEKRYADLAARGEKLVAELRGSTPAPAATPRARAPRQPKQ